MQLLRKLRTATGQEFAESASDWVVLADDEQPQAGGANVVSLTRYMADPGKWDPRNDDWTVLIQPADELLSVPAALLALPELLIEFPAFTDGRGYSHAATLRQHHGYAGELVAVGDVRRDQLDFMQETGFTAFEITGNDTVAQMRTSLGELSMPEHRLYSGAAI